MKVAAGILTFDMLKYFRQLLFDQTYQSLAAEADSVFVYDNASNDGTAQYLREATVFDKDASTHTKSIKVVTNHSRAVSSCGGGMNRTFNELYHSDADIIVFSNDDMKWRQGWRHRLEEMWTYAPQELLIISGMVCNTYWFNKPIGALDLGKERVLLRESATGGAWTMRRENWPLVFPINEMPGDDDVRKCHELRDQGYYVAEVPLAEHLGAEYSTWGNTGWNSGDPVNYEEWMIH